MGHGRWDMEDGMGWDDMEGYGLWTCNPQAFDPDPSTRNWVREENGRDGLR